MKLNRGDVVVTRFPHASGFRGKKRPALVVQADVYNGAVAHLIVAQITSNLAPANDPAFVLIDVSTPDGQASGLGQDSMISGLFLATVFADQVDGVIGKLSPSLMQKVDTCLKVARASISPTCRRSTLPSWIPARIGDNGVRGRPRY